MSCATKTDASSLLMRSSAADERSAFLRTMAALIDAFREALEMRRAVHSRYFLNDE
jgi:hypothetical protein